MNKRIVAALLALGVAGTLLATAAFAEDRTTVLRAQATAQPSDANSISQKYVDNGDGTYSVGVALVGTVTGTPTVTPTRTVTPTGTPPTATSTATALPTATNTPTPTAAMVRGDVASGLADSGNPVKMACVYNATPVATVTPSASAVRMNCTLDAASNINVSLNTQLSGEDQTNAVFKVEGQFCYANITTATTTVVKSGATLLHAITFNKPVASEVWTIYDNTAGSGTKVGTITLPGTLLQEGPYTAVYDVKLSTGLTITSGSTTDGTVSYRC